MTFYALYDKIHKIHNYLSELQETTTLVQNELFQIWYKFSLNGELVLLYQCSSFIQVEQLKIEI